jgi:hypothetical protein
VLAADAGTGRAGPDPDGNAHHLSVRPGQPHPAPASRPAAEAALEAATFAAGCVLRPAYQLAARSARIGPVRCYA